MARWAGIENNVVFVFHRRTDSNPPEPYRTIFKNFIVRVNSGMDATKAIKHELGRIHSPFMRHVFLNIVSVIENNGDLRILLSKFEYEAFKIEETLWSNQIRLYKDRILLHILNLMVFVTLVRLYLLDQEKVWITICSSISMGVGVIVAYHIKRPKY